MNANPDEEDGMRLDKWLWVARLFKTRRLAAEAIQGGKVQVNGQRSKPGKSIHAGARLRVHKGSLEWELTVKAVSPQRRPASEAILLYEEDATSRLRRQEMVRERRESGTVSPASMRKPNKRERRLIQHFTNGPQD
jgi:ribosome-associated heat shock protein Hsp15